MLALLASPKNAALAALTLALGLSLLWGMSEHGRRTTAEARVEQLGARLATASDEIEQALATVAEAAAINRRQAEAIARISHERQAARAALAAQQAAAQAQDAEVRRLYREASERDRARRARAEVPVEDMNAALREAAAGL